MNIEKHQQEFIKTIETSKNLSEKTIRAYNSDLNDYFLYYRNNKRLFFNGDIVNDYFNDLINERKLKDTTISRKIITLKQYYNFLNENYNVKNPFDKVKYRFKKEKRLPKTLTIQEVEKLLDTLYKSLDDASIYTKFESYRDLAILDILISTGVRIHEVCNITLDDINYQERIILIHGKGRKQRLAYISSEKTWNNIIKYIDIRNQRCNTSNYLFVNKFNYKLSINSIDNIYRKYKKLANINKKSTPHYLRHTFATNLLSNGADIRSVQELLGHSSISITEIYTEVSKSRKIEVLSKYNYRNQI